MEKETELQQLIRRIGPEARALIDALNAEQAAKHNAEKGLPPQQPIKRDFASGNMSIKVFVYCVLLMTIYCRSY
jgi:hypothetical protein